MARPTASQLAPFFAALKARDDVSPEELEAILNAGQEYRTVAPGTDLVREGDRPQQSTLILSGIAVRYSSIEDGGRQITAIHYPGDFVDLHSFPLKIMDHSVAAVTQCVIGVFPHRALDHITQTFPHLTRMLWLLTLIDGAIHRQWLVAKGQLTADEQLAHFFCEQYVRATTAGVVANGAFQFPFTQQQLGDALGLSVVHTNRTLQRLRQAGHLAWDGAVVQILNWEALREYANFNPAYLHFEKVPR